MPTLRRLNDEGVRRMVEFLDSQTTDTPAPYESARQILVGVDTTDSLPRSVTLPVAPPQTRFDMAQLLHSAVTTSGVPDALRDRGLWSWIALFWFEALCTKGPGGRWKLGERARWIPASSDWQKYYRHLVLGPYSVYTAHADSPECTRAVLANNIHSPGDLYEQIAARQFLVSSQAVLATSTALYWNGDSLKRGARGSGAGSVRRLAIYFRQIDRTFDLVSLTADTILTMLPREYRKFQPER